MPDTQHSNKASKTCQILSSIRCKTELSYRELTEIFINPATYNPQKHDNYLYGFFEECWFDLIKRFMKENSISKEQIIFIFNCLPESGEKSNFRKILQSGKF